MGKAVTNHLFYNKYGYNFVGEFNAETMILNYQEFDSDDKEIFSVKYKNIDVYKTQEDIDRLTFRKTNFIESSKYHLCSTFALMSLLDKSFEDTYRLQAEYGIKWKSLPNFAPAVFDLLSDIGYKQIGDFSVKNDIYISYSLRDFIYRHMTGNYLLLLIHKPDEQKDHRSHIVSLKDGILYNQCFSKLTLKENNDGTINMISSLRNLLNNYNIKIYCYKE